MLVIYILQVETIRKEIQSFLVLRALYKKTHTIATNATALPDNVDDLCASITDSSFLCLEVKNMMSANYTTGMLVLSPYCILYLYMFLPHYVCKCA